MSMHDKPRINGKKDEEPSEADIYAGRLNFDLVRSQQALRSFFKPTTALTKTTAADEDDDTDVLDELAGLGTKPKQVDSNGAFSSTLSVKSRSSGDKLLEQILGKRAAQAKRKELHASKSADVKKDTDAVKAKPTHQKKDEDDSEEEGGRAAAFTSQRQKQQGGRAANTSIYSTAEGAVQQGHVSNLSGDDDGLNPASGVVEAADSEQEDDSRPAKKRAGGGYLDELLAAKAKKKKKNKRKQQQKAAQPA